MPRPRKEETTFDVSKALESFAVSLSADPNYILYKAMPAQEAFHLDKRRKKIFMGGNRAGKTYGGVAEDVGWITKRHKWREEIRSYKRPIHGRLVAKDFKTLQSVHLPLIKQIIPTADLINSSWEDSYSKQEQILTLANGSTMDFKTYDQDVDSHASKSLHFIHFDEPPPKAIYMENQLRLLDTYDEFEGCGAWWMTYTGTGGKDWAYRDLWEPAKKGERTDIYTDTVSTDDNYTISNEAREEVFAGMSEIEVKIRRHGEYVDLTGAVFAEWSKAHVISPEELMALWGPKMLPPRNWKLYWSIDDGFTNATAIYWHAVSTDNQIITFHERHLSGVLIKDHAAAVIEYEIEIDRSPDYRTGDPAMKQRDNKTGTSKLQEYARCGVNIYVESVPRDGTIGINKMKQYMELNPATGKPFWRIYDCPQLDKELQDLHWAKYASNKIADTKNPQEQVHKYKDHGFDSCKYFFTAMPDLTPTQQEISPAERYEVEKIVSVAWDPANAVHSMPMNLKRIPQLAVGIDRRDQGYGDFGLDDSDY